MEAADHSGRRGPVSPIPPPSATDTHHSSSSRRPHPYPRWYKSVSGPRPYSTPESNPLVATAHCSTSSHHTNSPSAPDDSPPCPHLHCQSHIRGLWPNYRPLAIDCSSQDSYPCKMPMCIH